MAVIAMQSLTDHEPWRAFAPGERRVCVDGVSVWRQVLRPTPAYVPLASMG